MKKAAAGLALALTLTGVSVTPAEAAEQPTRLTASAYGNAIYYRTSLTGSWKRFERGTSRNFDSNDAVKSSGQSFAIVRSLYRVDCVNQPANKALGLPQNEDPGTLQAYPKKGCKN